MIHVPYKHYSRRCDLWQGYPLFIHPTPVTRTFITYAQIAHQGNKSHPETGYQVQAGIAFAKCAMT